MQNPTGLVLSLIIYFTPFASSVCLREDLHAPYQMTSDPWKEKLFDGESIIMWVNVLFYMRSKHLVSLILPLLQDVFVQKRRDAEASGALRPLESPSQFQI